MKYKNYNSINGKYSEAILFNEYEVLFYDGRIYRDTLPAGSFFYEIGHSAIEFSQISSAL